METSRNVRIRSEILSLSEEGVLGNAFRFFQETNNCTSGLYNKDGTFKIDSSSPSFMCIWSTLVLLIKSVNGEICQTMKGFGFSESGGFSPFSCHFPTSDMTELREKLLKYLLLIF